jgi:hypothetical protein
MRLINLNGTQVHFVACTPPESEVKHAASLEAGAGCAHSQTEDPPLTPKAEHSMGNTEIDDFMRILHR